MRFIMIVYLITGAKVLNFRHYTKQKDLKSIYPSRGGPRIAAGAELRPPRTYDPGVTLIFVMSHRPPTRATVSSVPSPTENTPFATSLIMRAFSRLTVV